MKVKQSVYFFAKAVEEDPSLEKQFRLGVALTACGEYVGAIPILESVLERNDSIANAHYNLGLCYESLGQYDKAVASFEQAIYHGPKDDVMAHVAIAGCYYRLGESGLAYFHHSKALEIETKEPDQIAARSFVRLLRGDYRQGLADYEMRVFSRAAGSETARRFEGGTALKHTDKNRHVFLYAEQGIGDAIQMLRFIPDVLKQGHKVTLGIHGALVSLVKQNFPEIRVFDFHEKQWREPPKLRCSLMSLPYVFGYELETIPNKPYLKAPNRGTNYGFAHNENLRVGICEYGNSNHLNDLDRSIPKEHRGFLENVPGIELVYLSKDDCYWTLNDLSDTADLIQELDLVVTVDTAVAHLAGAMGKPTYCFVPSSPEWRWGLSGIKSPWYPSLTLLRRKSHDAWPKVLDQAKAIVGEYARKEAA